MQEIIKAMEAEKKEKMSKEEMMKRISKTILIQEIRSTQMKISPKDFESIAIKMEKNLNVMKEIEGMIEEQG